MVPNPEAPISIEYSLSNSRVIIKVVLYSVWESNLKIAILAD